MLWLGYMLTVVAFQEKTRADGSKVMVAEALDQEGLERRAQIRKEFHALREQQRTMDKSQDEEHAKLKARILELDEQHREAIVHVRLRADLMSYWPEKECWVQDGNILSDAQQEVFKQLTGGKKVLPEKQREALLMLEAMGQAGPAPQVTKVTAEEVAKA